MPGSCAAPHARQRGEDADKKTRPVTDGFSRQPTGDGACDSGVHRPQRIALQARRELLQGTDAAGFGLVAPRLQVVQGFAGAVAARLEHRRQARAMLDQRADARAYLSDAELRALDEAEALTAQAS